MFAMAVLFIIAGTEKAAAQVRVNVNINIGNQPAWGPAGYDYVDYYYLPDIDVYYYVPQRQFIYLDGGNWVFVHTLPARYRSYDLYRGYKVVINESRPYLRHEVYRVRYSNYRGHYNRQSINRGDAKYKNYKKGNGHRKGKGRGYGRH